MIGGIFRVFLSDDFIEVDDGEVEAGVIGDDSVMFEGDSEEDGVFESE